MEIMSAIPLDSNTTIAANQTTALAAFGALGYSSTVGETNHYCQDRHALKVLLNNNETNEFTYKMTPLNLKAFCDGSTAIVGSVITTAASMALWSSF